MFQHLTKTFLALCFFIELSCSQQEVKVSHTSAITPEELSTAENSLAEEEISLLGTLPIIGSNKCLVKNNDTTCTINVVWKNAPAGGCLWVTQNEGKDINLFACSGKTEGKQQATWITPKHKYEFFMTSSKISQEKITSYIVNPVTELSANANHCIIPAGQSTCSQGALILKWQSPFQKTCLFVHKDDIIAPLKVVSCSLSGEISPNWLGHSAYEFQLRQTSDPNSPLLSSVIVYGRKPVIGVNQYDLVARYAFSTPTAEENLVSQNISLKGLRDAAALGIKLIRFNTFGYQQEKLVEIKQNPALFFAKVKEIFDEAARLNVKLNPVFFWNSSQIPDYSTTTLGKTETLHDLLLNPQSESSKTADWLIDNYFKYVGVHPAVEFISMSNEWNLLMDHNRTVCFTSQDLTGFARRFRNSIRRYDAFVPISSGYSLVIKSAKHLADAAQDKCKTGIETWTDNWTVDSTEEAKTILKIINDPFDLVEVHLYNVLNNLNRYNIYSDDDGGIIKFLQDFSKENKKMLFVGEFGESQSRADAFQIKDPTFVENSTFSRNVLSNIANNSVPYSAIWVWNFYQYQTYRDVFASNNNKDKWFSIEPGFRDGLITAIQSYNKQIQGDIETPAAADTQKPTCFISYPFAKSTISANNIIVSVLTSDIHKGRTQPVKLSIAIEGKINKQASAVNSYPYQATFAKSLFKGDNQLTISATATDMAGNTCQDSIQVNL